MTDIVPVVHARPVDAVGECVGGALRSGDAGPEAHATEPRATVGQPLARFAPRPGMEDLPGQPCGAVESLDDTPSAHALGIAGGGHDDSERDTRIPLCVGRVEPPA